MSNYISTFAEKTMTKVDEIPVRLYRGSIEDRQYMSKEEALKYVKDLFNREADKIDQKYNDSNYI